MKTIAIIVCASFISLNAAAQEKGSTLQTTPYGATTPAEVKEVMDRVLKYVDDVTPYSIVSGENGIEITNFTKVQKGATLRKTQYNITSHEWGLAYSAMMAASDATGDSRYAEYVIKRFEFLAKASSYFRQYKKVYPGEQNPLEHFLFPGSLDDTGSMCAAIIQALRRGWAMDLKKEAEISIDYILTKQQRLADGTFARNRPLPNTVWVDDLYQGIPAIAEMGKLIGEKRYFDEAVNQVLAFAGLLFDQSMGVCRHGWVQGKEPQPEFYWARANGWAVLAISSLLDVLPESHPQRKPILDLFKAYSNGLLKLQSGQGFWHQLLDRNDSFLETSATAMFTYVFAHGIDKGWLDVHVYGPPAVLGWKAVTTKVNSAGQVEGTSAGTSLAFDAAFYYQRPVGTGPHGYGSVILAGAAVYKLLKDHSLEGNGPVMFSR